MSTYIKLTCQAVLYKGKLVCGCVPKGLMPQLFIPVCIALALPILE